MTAKDVLKHLSVRHGIRSSRYFVGRVQERSSLETRLTRPYDPVWIHGPHRIGKSSLAWIGARIAQESGARVFEVDVMDCRTLDQALAVVIEAARRAGFQLDGENPRKAFRRLPELFDESGVVVIFDEFDQVAVNLRTEEQAYLRMLASAHDCLGFVFVTAQPPASVMEEVSDVASRLSGVCKVHAVVPLEHRDVRQLCELIAADMGFDVLREAADEVWERVGGFTLGSIAFVEALARRVQSGGVVDEFALEETLDELASDVVPHFRRYFAGLHLESRLVAAGRLEPERAERALRKDKLWGREGFVGYRLLRDVAAEFVDSSGEPTEEPAACRVLRLAAEINDALRLQKMPLGFRMGTTTLRVYALMREPVTEAVFEESLDYLYKTFFELARGTKPVGGKKPYLLPEPFASQYQSAPAVGAISDLRNFVRHEHTRASDDERPNRYYVEAGETYERYCGRSAPASDEDRKRVRDGIVEDLASVLTEIRRGILEALVV